MSEMEIRPPDEAAAPAAGAEEVAVPEVGDVRESEADTRRGRPRLQLEDLVVGVETSGKVMATAKFGVFVDIGAVTDGLVHVSEFPQRRVRNVEDLVKQGDNVDVWIKDVDIKGNRISLSMRQKPMHPMKGLTSGDVLTGTVTSVTKYGAFVEIGAETEGLVHISEMSSGFVERPTEVVNVGETIEVRVKEIDAGRERISLSMVGLANDTGTGVAVAANVAPADDQGHPDEERMPTVVEMALRKALGQMQDGGDGAEGEAPEPEAKPETQGSPAAEAPGGPAETDAEGAGSLGEVYERMLAEYRASKKGD